jgi:phospholipid N-methyltransferase
MRQRLADYRVFWREFRQAYHTTGAVLPSGRALCRALSYFVRNGEELHCAEALAAPSAGRTFSPHSSSRRILEVGPGTGAVTIQIARDMRPTDQLTLVERNDQFVEHLRNQLSKSSAFTPLQARINLLHSSVEDVPEDQPYDLIISGLPLNNFSVDLVEALVGKMKKLLAPGGILTFFEYVAIRRAKAMVSPRSDRERLRGIEQILNELLGSNEVRRDLVFTNVPPAWVHHVKG